MENFDRKEYLSIGEFAKASGISRKNLIYYDSIGLFTPDIILDNGYRYYYYRKLYTVNMIRTLKEIGMTLNEIKEFTDKRTPATMIDLFTNQRKTIEAEIEKLNQIKDMMDMQVAIAQLASTVEVGKIGIEYREREAIFLGKNTYKSTSEKNTLSKMVTKFYQDAASKGYECAFPWGIHIDVDHYEEEGFDSASQFYYCVPTSTTYKPEGMYAVGYTYGDFRDRVDFYGQMFAYIEKQGYKIVCDIYEDYLLNEISTKIPEDYILRIAMRVEKK